MSSASHSLPPQAQRHTPEHPDICTGDSKGTWGIPSRSCKASGVPDGQCREVMGSSSMQEASQQLQVEQSL